MSRMTIAGGTGRVTALRSFAGPGRSLRDLEDDARSLGYDGIEFKDVGREVRAISYNARGQRAEALGRNELAAAQTLVRTLKRR